MLDAAWWHVFKTVCFWSPFMAWFVAQSIKILSGFSRTRRVDYSFFVSTGGMPSAHTSMVTALTASIGMTAGFDTPVFCVTLAFALLVMFDAAIVRRAAGLQAKLLNEIVDELFKEGRFSERKLAELLGHTRLEVVMGVVVGILVAMIVVSMPYLYPDIFGR